ncbi:MAG TPA: hypothetical protein VN939_04100 [Chthoniobacterales bacterium]|jgi:hypothetical protein|nr:hypothetical protein [Chthoniobacterales bacterium]
MSNESVKVQIERGSGRRRIILAALIEHRFKDQIGMDEKEFEIEDWEVEAFISSGLSEEEKGWAYRKYHEAFHKNVGEAIARLHPPIQPKYGRAATGILDDLQPQEVSADLRPKQ